MSKLKSFDDFVNENLVAKGEYNFYGPGSLMPIVKKLISEGKNESVIRTYLYSIGVAPWRIDKVFNEMNLPEISLEKEMNEGKKATFEEKATKFLETLNEDDEEVNEASRWKGKEIYPNWVKPNDIGGFVKKDSDLVVGQDYVLLDLGMNVWQAEYEYIGKVGPMHQFKVTDQFAGDTEPMEYSDKDLKAAIKDKEIAVMESEEILDEETINEFNMPDFWEFFTAGAGWELGKAAAFMGLAIGLVVLGGITASAASLIAKARAMYADYKDKKGAKEAIDFLQKNAKMKELIQFSKDLIKHRKKKVDKRRKNSDEDLKALKRVEKEMVKKRQQIGAELVDEMKKAKLSESAIDYLAYNIPYVSTALRMNRMNEAKGEKIEIMRFVNGRTKELIEGTIDEIMDRFSSAMDKLRDSGSGNQYKDDPKTAEELVKYLNAAQSYLEKKDNPKNTYELKESELYEFMVKPIKHDEFDWEFEITDPADKKLYKELKKNNIEFATLNGKLVIMGSGKMDNAVPAIRILHKFGIKESVNEAKKKTFEDAANAFLLGLAGSDAINDNEEDKVEEKLNKTTLQIEGDGEDIDDMIDDLADGDEDEYQGPDDEAPESGDEEEVKDDESSSDLEDAVKDAKKDKKKLDKIKKLLDESKVTEDITRMLNDGAMSEIHLLAKEAKDEKDFMKKAKKFVEDMGVKFEKGMETMMKAFWSDMKNESVEEAKSAEIEADGDEIELKVSVDDEESGDEIEVEEESVKEDAYLKAVTEGLKQRFTK